METCESCGFNEEDCMCETTNEADVLPSDYETCGDCGFDHGYEYEEAAKWHEENPGSYRGLGIEENDEFGDFEVCDPLEDTCGEPLKFDDLRHSNDPASDMTRFDAGSDELPDNFEWAIDEPTENELEDIEMGELEVQDALERKNRQFDVDESDELDEDGAVGYVATGYNENKAMLARAAMAGPGKVYGNDDSCPNCGSDNVTQQSNPEDPDLPDVLICRDCNSFVKTLDEAIELNPKTQSDDIKSRLAKGQKCTMEVKPENFKAAEEKLAKLPAQIRKLITLKVIDDSKDLDESFSRHMDAIVLRESRQVEKQPDSPYRNLAKSRKDALGRTVMRVLR